MKFALVNPNWDFTGSTYFGCRDPHYPLELLFAADQIRQAGHEPLLVDAQADILNTTETRRRIDAFAPDFLVIPTAPSYLFWRCPPPEVRVPKEWFAALGSKAVKVAVGPHTSATPLPAMRKMDVQVGMRGEIDITLSQLASQPWQTIDGCCWRDDHGDHFSPTLGVADMKALRALDFHDYDVAQHRHRHHVFSGEGCGAELEFARGCPWSCNFCNKTLFRNKFRERDVDQVLLEIDRLIARGVDYVYFIDEIFGVGKNVRTLLEGIAERELSIGFQSRIDLWDEDSLDLLGRAHCISMECGIESITDHGRDQLNKGCRMSTERLTELLVYARQRIPWVQANLILTEHDDKNEIRRWQEHLKSQGVWVSEPVPMFPFPGTPLYAQMFGPPDDQAWERAHHYYTSAFSAKGFSDIQEQKPASIEDLECTC
ncbi:MAG TPA: TIGR04295 family B12-binding domain-containing radical SAM protein [Terriglobales bacterium]|jgi:B12-binding domain/radical SAM domain protein of rhizo-twelve system|nr:TIGR04295 family B12-binding domain-containing radical SAM protein [Terriglobales bacterium]